MSQPEPTRGRHKGNNGGGALSRGVRTIKEIWADPRTAAPHARALLLDVWRARGGGLYGIGYVLAFVFYEARMVTGELAAAESVTGFLGEQLLEFIFRLTFLSIVIVFQALLWPLSLISWGGLPALGGLLVAYLAFEHVLRPRVELAFPELAADRVAREVRKAEKRERKRQKRTKRSRT